MTNIFVTHPGYFTQLLFSLLFITVFLNCLVYNQEGVCVARKDFYLMKHPVIGVPNLYVIKSMQSLLSRNYVKEQFAWRHYYWTLTNEVPATVRRPQKPDARGPVERGFGGHPEKWEMAIVVTCIEKELIKLLKLA
ncbi:Small ribosomal subunit protein [Trichinella spiralis]|uniref:Small ribosomal subunit protein n=1 Tax=Trichinella spiralis TaxID=6334 RepID=A0ABR3KH29_TRISP